MTFERDSSVASLLTGPLPRHVKSSSLAEGLRAVLYLVRANSSWAIGRAIWPTAFPLWPQPFGKLQLVSWKTVAWPSTIIQLDAALRDRLEFGRKNCAVSAGADPPVQETLAPRHDDSFEPPKLKRASTPHRDLFLV